MTDGACTPSLKNFVTFKDGREEEITSYKMLGVNCIEFRTRTGHYLYSEVLQHVRGGRGKAKSKDPYFARYDYDLQQWVITKSINSISLEIDANRRTYS